MNIFVLCTGRCGSTTFMQACSHITNFSASHESLAPYIGKKRFDYPKNHIEVDNRLSWYLGRLDKVYGEAPFYVHLTRDPDAVHASYAKRQGFGIMKAFENGIIKSATPGQHKPILLAEEICNTANENIIHFLKDKPNKMNFRLENAEHDFRTFWDAIEAQGDLAAAMACWNTKFNATGSRPPRGPLTVRIRKRILQILKGKSTPGFNRK